MLEVRAFSVDHLSYPVAFISCYGNPGEYVAVDHIPESFEVFSRTFEEGFDTSFDDYSDSTYTNVDNYLDLELTNSLSKLALDFSKTIILYE